MPATAPAAPLTNTPEYTVSELSSGVKRTLEDAYGHVRVRAELGRVSRPRSGHVYLDLKDDKAVLASVMWKGVAGKLSFAPEEGLEVIAEGRLTTYPGQSKYQLVIEKLAPAGVGALMAMLEERKQKLQAEGLFDAERKRPLPFLPDVIGVVTSPSGAVIRDILHRVRDRFPRRVLVWPTLVQGEGAAAQVAAAVTGFNHLDPVGPVPRPDVLIVARGGGSLEDLWAFNEEVVARAVAASAIPVVSAVGHETDVTLIDFVADRRAPTPTGAAEMVVPVRTDLLAKVADLGARTLSGTRRTVEQAGRDVASAARALPKPEDLLGLPAQRVDAAGERSRAALRTRLAEADARLRQDGGALRPALLRAGLRERGGRVQALADRLRVDAARERIAHLGEAITEGWRRALAGLSRHSKDRKRALADASARLAAQDPQPMLADAALRLAQASARLDAAPARALAQRTQRLTGLAGVLEALSHKGVLARGYALVRGADGGLIRRREEAQPGAAVALEFADGSVDARVEGESAEPPRKPAKAKPAASKPAKASKQQDLF